MAVYGLGGVCVPLRLRLALRLLALVLLMLRRGEGTEPTWAPVLLSDCDEYRDEAPEPAAETTKTMHKRTHAEQVETYSLQTATCCR